MDDSKDESLVDLDAWPNCPTPDCQYKVCLWGGAGLCHYCSTRAIGAVEMRRRYVNTHPEVLVAF